jgi:hypothetical protein
MNRRLLTNLVSAALVLGICTVDTASASTTASTPASTAAWTSHQPRAARSRQTSVDIRIRVSTAALAQSYLLNEMGRLLGHRHTVTRGRVMAPLFISRARASG